MALDAGGYSTWLVTRVETVKVSARSESEATFKGEQTLDFFGSETSNIQAEELDEFGLTEERGPED